MMLLAVAHDAVHETEQGREHRGIERPSDQLDIPGFVQRIMVALLFWIL